LGFCLLYKWAYQAVQKTRLELRKRRLSNLQSMKAMHAIRTAQHEKLGFKKNKVADAAPYAFKESVEFDAKGGGNRINRLSF
jgi:hypothetical protein